MISEAFLEANNGNPYGAGMNGGESDPLGDHMEAEREYSRSHSGVSGSNNGVPKNEKLVNGERKAVPGDSAITQEAQTHPGCGIEGPRKETYPGGRVGGPDSPESKKWEAEHPARTLDDIVSEVPRPARPALTRLLGGRSVESKSPATAADTSDELIARSTMAPTGAALPAAKQKDGATL